MGNNCPGPIPPGAKQTNCWRLSLIFVIFNYTINFITYLNINVGLAVVQLVYMALAVWMMMHIAWVKIDVSDQVVDIHMGPQKCSFCAWFCSNRLYKREIVMVEVKQRQCCWDIIPRCYCAPVNWWCCHKSYSAYWWPCCCDGCNMCNLCDGDSNSERMIQFNLTQDPCDCCTVCCKHCAPCPGYIALCWCCVYNRVAVSVNEGDKEQVLRLLAAQGYALQPGLNFQSPAPTGGQGVPTTTTDGPNTTATATATATTTTTTAYVAPAVQAVPQPGVAVQGQPVQYQMVNVNGQMMMVMPAAQAAQAGVVVQGGVQPQPVQYVVQQPQQPQQPVQYGTPGQPVQYGAQPQPIQYGVQQPAQTNAPPSNVSAPPAYAPGSGEGY